MSKIRLADYIFKYLADCGVEHVFMVAGGGAMHLNDALAKEKRIKYLCNHHEQACSIAAEGYARIARKLGVINVTTGPGAINAINGVFGAWTDSVPMLIISGQVKTETTIAHHNLENSLRQLGDQEVNIIPMISHITKYAVSVHQTETIKYHLERAIYEAVSGRPGPCWLDIPLNIQAALIDIENLEGFTPPSHLIEDSLISAQSFHQVVDRMFSAKRPLIMAGSGIRLAKSEDEFYKLIELLKVPVITSWSALDILNFDSPYFAGRAGTIGDRAGNFNLQSCDFLLVLGSRLNIRQISYNYKSFAKNAYVVHVDIDEAELQKPTFKAHFTIKADLKSFIPELIKTIDENGLRGKSYSEWLNICKQRCEKYPVVLEKYRHSLKINPYCFIDDLFKILEKNDVVMCGDGTVCIVTMQAAKLKLGQRVVANSGSASMGYDVPASIGAALAKPNQRIICLAGDGSIQMNIQELQTIVHHQLDIKIFVLNNNGYLSMRLTQSHFFNKNFIGCTPESGVSNPDFVKVAQAYGLTAFKLDHLNYSEQYLEELLKTKGPILIEVILDPDQGFEPKLASRVLEDGSMKSSELEDMSPFLDPQEIIEVMSSTS